MDLQKEFDAVDHNILLPKLHHYGIRDLANNWFSSYLSNRKQFVSINGFNSTAQVLNMMYHRGQFRVPFFLIFINDLHNAIKFFQPLHFADDTCLLNIPSKISEINKS